MRTTESDSPRTGRISEAEDAGTPSRDGLGGRIGVGSTVTLGRLEGKVPGAVKLTVVYESQASQRATIR